MENIIGADAETIADFIREHNIANDGLRLGQRFVIIYISQLWPELFYETSERKALKKICEWLTDNQYYDRMPPLIKKRS